MTRYRAATWLIGAEKGLGCAVKSELEKCYAHRTSQERKSSTRLRANNSQSVMHVFVDFHDGGLVAAPVAVIRRAEDCDHALVVAPLVPLHHELMRASY